MWEVVDRRMSNTAVEAAELVLIGKLVDGETHVFQIGETKKKVEAVAAALMVAVAAAENSSQQRRQVPWGQDRNSVDTMSKKKDRLRNNPGQRNWLRTGALKRKTAGVGKEELDWGSDSGFGFGLDSENMDSKRGNPLAAFLTAIEIEREIGVWAFGETVIRESTEKLRECST